MPYDFEEEDAGSIKIETAISMKRGIRMKNKKSTLYISGIITIIGIVGFIILQFRCYELIGILGGTEFLSNLRQLGIVVTSGLFTSALVTFLISMGEYKNERVEALENIYLAAEDLEQEFFNIRYFLPDEPKKLVQNVLGELDNNECNIKYNKQLAESVSKFKDQQKADEAYNHVYLKLSYAAQNAFRNYVWENTDERIKEIYTEPFQIKEYLDEECEEKIKKYSEQLEEAMKSFLRFQEVHTNALTVAYGKMDFIFANNSVRQHIYEKLYCKLVEEVNLIKENNYHFKSYFDGKGGNRAVQCSFIWKLQESLLSEDENCYYRQFNFDLAMEMVQVLVYANGKDNIGEFPDLKRYMLCTKPGYYQRLKKQLEENGDKK